ncbi:MULTISPECIES: hypothetical protein [Paenibacillus]|uniref:Uncharacterized protein n=1 Tax=Paenibacillus curdlanolyticus YK9 TaxID=717606 RepID=E0I4U0_9BACL|nr:MULTISPECIES: hypothetical protein [Paenibacillus]EFM12621.1 conserved hypothetical protein [Paenibacillus curdlanolyticus YK9]
MDNGNEDLYQLLTYLIVVIVSSIIMVAWLKRKGRRSASKRDAE